MNKTISMILGRVKESQESQESVFQLQEQDNALRFVVQKAYQGGPWVDVAKYRDEPRTGLNYAIIVYRDAVKYNTYPDTTFRIVKRVIKIEETDVTPQSGP